MGPLTSFFSARVRSLKKVAVASLAVACAPMVALLGPAIGAAGLVLGILAIVLLPFLLVTMIVSSLAILLAGIFALVLMAVVAAAIARGLGVISTAEGTFERTLAVSGPAKLAVRTGSGSIIVRPGDSSTVRLAGKIQVTAGWGEDERAAQEKVHRIEANPPIEQEGDTVRIGEIPDEALRQGVSVAYEIIVPAGTQLRAFTGSGSIEAQGLGSITAETDSGAIRLQQQARGDIEVKTGSGSIRLNGLCGGLLAYTGSGSIRVEGLPARDWHVRSGSGSVQIHLPVDAGFELAASTRSGCVRAPRELLVSGGNGQGKVRGKANGGGPLIEVTTGSGNIRID
jgi:hypothetical protein